MLELLNKKYQLSQQLLSRTRKETSEQFAVTSCAEHPELFDASVALENDTWDELSFLDFTSAHHAHYDDLLERFPEFHLCMIDVRTDELVATGMCVPLYIPENAELPAEANIHQSTGPKISSSGGCRFFSRRLGSFRRLPTTGNASRLRRKG